MAASLADIDAIANNPAKASFANTIVAMERAGEALDRAMTYYSIWGSNLSTPEFREIQAEMAPKLSEYQSKITQNATLFARIKALHDDQANLKLTPHQARLLKLVYDRFQLNGAELAGEKRDRYAAINKELAELHTKFSNNLLADEEGWVTYLTPKQLGGLPASYVASAKAAADELGQAGHVCGDQHALLDGSVPHLFDRAGTARDRSGATTTAAGTMAMRTTTMR